MSNHVIRRTFMSRKCIICFHSIQIWILHKGILFCLNIAFPNLVIAIWLLIGWTDQRIVISLKICIKQSVVLCNSTRDSSWILFILHGFTFGGVWFIYVGKLISSSAKLFLILTMWSRTIRHLHLNLIIGFNLNKFGMSTFLFLYDFYYFFFINRI